MLISSTSLHKIMASAILQCIRNTYNLYSRYIYRSVCMHALVLHQLHSMNCFVLVGFLEKTQFRIKYLINGLHLLCHHGGHDYFYASYYSCIIFILLWFNILYHGSQCVLLYLPSGFVQHS